MTWAYERLKGLNPSSGKSVDAREFKRAGFPASYAKQFGNGVAELANALFAASEIRAAGFSCYQLRGHFDIDEIVEAGYTAQDFFEDGFPLEEVMTYSFYGRDFIDAGYDLQKVVRHLANMSDSSISSQQMRLLLKENGLTDEEIREAGF